MKKYRPWAEGAEGPRPVLKFGLSQLSRTTVKIFIFFLFFSGSVNCESVNLLGCRDFWMAKNRQVPNGSYEPTKMIHKNRWVIFDKKNKNHQSKK